MKRDIATEWITSLTSGEYTHGHTRLLKDGCHCALGVLCELAAQGGVCVKRENTDFVHPDSAVTLFDGNAASPPQSVMEWSGITKRGIAMIMTMNDQAGRGVKFGNIALFIDKNSENL